MFKKPEDIGIIHFTGIGGIGMSGIAEILFNLGYQVQGSDVNANYNTERLQHLGVKIFIGQRETNIEGAKLVVISSAVRETNPEVKAANSHRIPIIKRAEMLAELMRLKNSIVISGTHGKTTTTALVAQMLDEAKFAPTVVNGGIINSQKTNAWVGKSDWMVVESDESDGSFTKLPSQIVVVTNIDPEHLEHYGSFDNLKASFDTFVNNIPFYGLAVLCVDHPEVQNMISRIHGRRITTYGFSPQADVRADHIRADENGFIFDVHILDKSAREEDKHHIIKDIHLPMFGTHNVLNALASIAIAKELEFSDKTIKSALTQFSGVKRRFTITGKVGGITIVDDYGHHPVEISAVLKAARQATKKKIHAIIEPHRYTRISALFDEFCTCCHEADFVYISDIYAASEDPIKGITKDKLIEGFRQHGHKHVQGFTNPTDLAALVGAHCEEGDFVLFFGAGNVTKWAHDFPTQYAEFLQTKSRSRSKLAS